MKMLKIAGAGALCLLLWACFLSPGKFDARLDVRRDGTFTYRYAGEIMLITPHSWMDMMKDMDGEGDPEVDAALGDLDENCWDPPSKPGKEGKARACTPEEIKERREQREKTKAEQTAAMEAMRASFGGLDPRDPKSVDEFIRRLQTYPGWKRVVHKGKGVFDVEYEISGRLDRDFVFPTFPELDFVVPFVQATRRTDGSVRIAAPAFARSEQWPGAGAGVGALAGLAAKDGPEAAPLLKAEGTFTVTTDGDILTNNTREGPTASGGVKVLSWKVGGLDKAKPEALIRF